MRTIPGKRVVKVAREFYCTGDLQPVCELLEQSYFLVCDNCDYRTAGELTVKMAFVLLLFDDLLYIMDSETKIGGSYGEPTFFNNSPRFTTGAVMGYAV